MTSGSDGPEPAPAESHNGNWHHWWNQRGSCELRELPLTEWDLIHVRDADGPDDEYEGYLGQRGALLRKRRRSGRSCPVPSVG